MTWLGPTWDNRDGGPGLALAVGKTEVRRMKAFRWLVWVLSGGSPQSPGWMWIWTGLELDCDITENSMLSMLKTNLGESEGEQS